MADQETLLRTAVCFAFISALFSLCNGFNLDPKFSVLKKGPKGNYFGYSVTEHQVVRESDGRVSQNLLLVGAPREKVLLGSRTMGGAIYRCNALSTAEDDCVRLDTEPFNIPPDDVEDVEDQWLGVVLRSYGKGKKIVTCAHRYIRENAAVGICYTLLQTLDFMDKWIPCLGEPHTKFLEDFGLCQAGLSAIIGPQETMVMGAPGSVYWIGAVFQANISDTLGTMRGPFRSTTTVNPDEAGADKVQLPPTDKYSYLGYSVEVGMFDDTGSLYFVSGAPRSHEKGEVVFFRKMYRNHRLRYETEHKLLGTKDFAGFGSTLLTMNMNGDKYDDLIVGAPYYFEKGIGGAIYIYYGQAGMINSNSKFTLIHSREMSDKECIELGCEHARFGMSLAKLGDVNNDGFDDFAVGAPYEGKGAVYIYHGSKDGVSEMYAQRIAASDMPDVTDLKSFGYSLSGGLDLDANGYPDLLVGSYESGMVSLLRSRAVIRLQPTITVSPSNMIDLAAPRLCRYDQSSRICLELEVCLTFTAEPADRFTSSPQIEYTIEAEPTRSLNRLEMITAQNISKKSVEGSMLLYPQGSGRSRCVKELVYLKEPVSDKLNPVELSVTFSQAERAYQRPRPGDPLPDINEYPILSTDGSKMGTQPNMVSTYVDFLKECGPDNKCISNLQFESILRTKKERGRYVMVEEEKSEVDMQFTVTNLGEAAYLTRVYIQKPLNLDYQGVEGVGQDTSVNCRPAEDSKILIICDSIGNPLKQNSTVTFTVTLSNRIRLIDQVLNITTWVNTTSGEQTPEGDKAVFDFIVVREADLELSVNVLPDDQILCSGEPRGASAMQTEEDIGPAVKHSFLVTNVGPSNVSQSQLTIEWPLEVGGENSQGKYLLYLMLPPVVEKRGPALCYLDDKDTVNPLGIKSASEEEVVVDEVVEVEVDRIEPLDRTKRQTKAESRVKRAQSGLLVLGCKQKTAKCRKIRCDIGNLGKNEYVKITLYARLWESTLLQDYRKSGDVQIASYGYVEVDPALDIKQDPRKDRIEAVTYAVPDFKDRGVEEIEWWWILLAVLGGILLLILIIFILYKCGFFKRKRPEDMQMYKAEKKQQKMLEEYEDGEM